MAERSFSPALFSFLRELAEHNDREWFAKNKERYLDVVQEPALEFVRGFSSYLHKISPHFVADDRPSGGSLFRIYRDVRFSKDKSPYKTHVGLDFRHKASRDVHSPSFYLHLQPGESFAAAGIWHPDPQSLAKLREAIAARSPEWMAVRKRKLPVEGGALKRPPRGFAPDHPFIEDLKRTDFVTSVRLADRDVCNAGFMNDFAAACRGIATSTARS